MDRGAWWAIVHGKGEGERRGKERGGKGEGKRKKKGDKKRNYEELTLLWRLTNYKICRVVRTVPQPLVLS